MLTSIAYLLLGGVILGMLFERLRLPSLVGMIVAGILLGGSGLDILDPSLMACSTALRQGALVVILLRAGLALRLSELRRVGLPALLLSFLPACFEIGGVMLLAPRLLGVSLLEAAIIGSVVAAVSPAVVVPKMLHLMRIGRGRGKGIPQMIMAAGSLDDIFVIVLFGAFTTLATGGAVGGAALLDVPLSIISGALLGLLSGLILSAYLERLTAPLVVKVMILLSISFLFLALESTLKSYFPLSGLLAVMAMGITLLWRSESLAAEISSQLNSVWRMAEVVLFVLVGASIDIKYAAAAGGAAVALILLSMIFRMGGVFASTIKSPLNMRERLFCMIAYSPKATVQAAIGALPLAMGLPCGEITLTVAVLSILITAPLGAFGIDRCSGVLLRD